MRAAVAFAPRDIRLGQVPLPELGPHEVRLNVRAVGICGSDIHLFRGEHPYQVFPMIYGHEFVATVGAVDEAVEGLAPGTPVVVEPLLACGRCYPCRIGRYNCCANLRVIGVHRNGGLAEHVIVPAERVFPVPNDLPAEVATLCEPFSIGLQAVARGEIGGADRVAILGAGPIGLAVLLIARSRGARVAVIDLLDSRLALARQLGADVTINGARVDAAAAITEWTDGEGASVVVEATGSARAVESTADLVASAGRIVLVGVTTKPVTFPGLDFTRKELTIVGSRNSASQFSNAVRFVSEHRATVAAMITHRFPFDQVVRAFQTADTQPEDVCKAVVMIAD
ncbi:MAG: zinc-binding alcohol dehydrogenase family protein [Chloroflexales bacterium]|nr:zinc-binding alcohol dehydrogenase family protein [Chloroflexales bacterium]